MNNKVKPLFIAMAAVVVIFIWGIFVTYKVTADKSQQVAVVNLQAVIAASKEVNTVRNERNSQLQEIQKLTDDANAKLEKISNKEEKTKKAEKYVADIRAKKAEFDNAYAALLQTSEQNIQAAIHSVAEKMGYTVVLNKTSVIEGGTDITDSVVDLVK